VGEGGQSQPPPGRVRGLPLSVRAGLRITSCAPGLLPRLAATGKPPLNPARAPRRPPRPKVFKGGLSRTGTQEGVQLRYFTHQELHELFKITPEGLATSETQQLLSRMHGRGPGSPAPRGGVVAAGAVAPAAPAPLPLGADEALRPHLEWVEAHAGCAGTSDHGALFQERDPEEQHLEARAAAAAAAAAAQRPPASAGGGGGPGGFFGSLINGVKARVFGGGRGGGGGGGGGGGAGRPGGGARGGGHWQGAGDLSDMLSGLGISDRARGHGGAAVPGAGPGPGVGAAEVEAFARAQRIQVLQRRAQELADQAAAAAATASSLGPSLPDGGAKVGRCKQRGGVRWRGGGGEGVRDAHGHPLLRC
jgi:hypothetical protein